MRVIEMGGKTVVVDIEVKTELGVLKGHGISGYSSGSISSVVVTSPKFEGESAREFAEEVLRAKADEAIAVANARETFNNAVAAALKRLNTTAVKPELP